MDAQELQRLKEAVQRVREYLDAREKRPEYSEAFIHWLNDNNLDAADLRVLVDALAERAVSPAESVQTLDGPEFNELLNWLFETHGTPWAFSEHRKRFIVHINAKLAFAHAEGRRSAMEELQPKIAAAYHEGHSEGAQWQLEAARTNIPSLAKDDPFAPDDDSNKDVKEAYQQGRAFVMKELEAKLEAAARDKDGNHVDDLRVWLDEAREDNEVLSVTFHACSLKLKQAEEELAKEKERADRAEADLAQWKSEYDEWMARALEAESRLAARQAPDLGKLTEWLTREMPAGTVIGDPVWWASRIVRALLAQPLQQEGGKEVLANSWPKDFHEVVKGAEDAAHRQGRAAAVEEAIMACESIAQDHRDQYKGRGKYAADNPRRADPHADGCFDGASECADAIRAISSQPSDNLQQASTAQAEPANAPKFAPWADRLGNDIARGATMRYPDGSTFFVSYDDSREGTGKWRAIFPDGESLWLGNQIGTKGQAVVADPAQATPPAHETIVADAGELVCTACGTTAQATPEGWQDLPEAARQNGGVVRAALIDLMAAVEPSALSGARDFEQQSEFRALFARARAALAATTAAEPVAWVRRHPDGALTAEFLEHAVIEPARKNSGSWVPLYRAAPPQQVDTSGLPG